MKKIIFLCLITINTSVLFGQEGIRFLDIGFGDWQELQSATSVIEALERNEPMVVFSYLDNSSKVEYDSLIRYAELLKDFWEDDNTYPPYLTNDYSGEELYYERIYFKKDINSDNVEYVAQFIIVVKPIKKRSNVLEIFFLKGADVLERDDMIRSVDKRTHTNKNPVTKIELLRNK